MNKSISLLISFLFISNVFWGQRLFHNELELPSKGLSQRVTIKHGFEPGEKRVLFDEEGPGCVLHWWFVYPRSENELQEYDRLHYFRVRIYYDGHAEPDVNVSMGQFFSILHERDLYTINNAAIKIVPLTALNWYFPIPFEHCRIELENTAPFRNGIWTMFDWQEYPGSEMTPYRFGISHKKESPADSAGSMLMADVSGEGFIAGMTKSLIKKDLSDDWYHSGGDLVMMDGEGTPRAIRGIGGEDVFNMSYGVWDIQNDWIGTPVRNDDPYERVMYRIFGPDPIWFYQSIIMRFGTKANDIETIVYYYVDASKEKSINTVHQWQLLGPFQCHDFETFERKEFPEENAKNWPSFLTADFNPYIRTLPGASGGPTTFPVPIEINSEHGWCDFAANYRGWQRTNPGTQPGSVSAYALGKITVDKAGEHHMEFGFDDWIKVWINGKLVYTGKHEDGFENLSLEVDLPEGESSVLVKLSNQDNQQWRLWAFNLKILI